MLILSETVDTILQRLNDEYDADLEFEHLLH